MTFIYMEIAEKIYKSFLRDIIKKVIDDPNEKWDDKVMEVLDDIFDYVSDD